MKLVNKAILFNCVYTFILILPAIINGYPIVYSDTSTYIASGFELEMPFDRPITYGLFIRLFSLNGLSLWTVIFSQTYILVYLTQQLIAVFFKNLTQIYTIVFYFLLLLTGIGWTCSQIMADVFTPLLIVSLFLSLIEHGKKKYLYYFIFLLSSTMHLSHFGINILLFLVLITLKLIPKYKLTTSYSWNSMCILFALAVFAFLTMLNPYSKSKHAFLFGSFVEHGIIKKYLDDNCQTHNYKICNYKDSLPILAADFIWDKNSPFYKVGGFKNTKDEFNEIIKNTLTSKKYLWLHFKSALNVTFEQLTSFNMGDGNGAFVGETLLYKRVIKFFPTEYLSYKNSHQNKSEMGLIAVFNRVQTIFILLVSIAIIFLLIKTKKQINKNCVFVVLLFMSFIVIHAASCGILANCANRYGCRVIWLLMVLVLVLIKNYKNYINTKLTT